MEKKLRNQSKIVSREGSVKIPALFACNTANTHVLVLSCSAYGHNAFILKREAVMDSIQKLSTACAAAPMFGDNARSLLLKAAANIEEESDDVFTRGNSSLALLHG